MEPTVTVIGSHLAALFAAMAGAVMVGGCWFVAEKNHGAGLWLCIAAFALGIVSLLLIYP